MSRARSAVAVRTTVQSLLDALYGALEVKEINRESHKEFYDVASFCRSQSEELGGEEGQDAWYAFQVGDWAVVGDLGLVLCRESDALESVSQSLGETVVAAVDSGFEFALFALYDGGEAKRLLILEDDELVEEGFPIAAERGQRRMDFDEEEAERLWTSYGLPTFEHDPPDDDFLAVSVSTSK